MAKKAAKQTASKKADDSTLFAFLAVFLGIIGFLIAILTKKEDKYVMFYAKQSLVLFIAMVIFWIASMILVFIPILGWFVMMVLYISIAILWLIGWINALSGKEKEIPIIGKYASKFKF